jgi:CRP-like cAMP-binding protein
LPLRVDPRRDRKLNRLVKAAEMRRLRRRQPLYQEGEPADEIYLLRSGFVRLVEPSAGPVGERTIGVAGPWEIVGDEGLYGGARRCGCVGGEVTTYQVLPGPSVFHVLKSTRQTFAALLQGYGSDLELARHLATGSPGPSVRQRLAHVLLDLGRRWGAREGKGLLLHQRITHQVLADLAGAHRSTVTTTLNDWIYLGVLAEAGRELLLARPEAMERIAAGREETTPPAPMLRVVDPLRVRR